jgi:hypothetical protein
MLLNEVIIMERQSNPSEVAKILAQIETEYCAVQSGLTGLAETARHAFITARMEQIHHLQSHLQTIVGTDAIRLVVEHLETL